MTESDTFYKLKGWKAWDIIIHNNYYGGKYYEFSGRRYTVVASTAEEAACVVLDNSAEILEDILTKTHYGGKKILSRSKALDITSSLLGDAKPSPLVTVKPRLFFTPDGPMYWTITGTGISQ
jgi:hypothetical protein